MAYLVGNCGGGWGAALVGAWPAGARRGVGLWANFVELHWLPRHRPRPACLTAAPAHCSAASMPSSPCSSSKAPSPGPATRTGYATLPKKMDRKARKMQRPVAVMAHVPRAQRAHRAGQPAPASAPAALCYGAVGPSVHVVWLGRDRKWSASTCSHVDQKEPRC